MANDVRAAMTYLKHKPSVSQQRDALLNMVDTLDQGGDIALSKVKTPDDKDYKLQKECIDRLQLGESVRSVITWLKEKEYDGCCDTFVRDCQDIIRMDLAEYAVQVAAESVKRLNGLYQKALEMGDYKQALLVQKELNRIAGLYEPKIGKPEDTEFVEINFG